MIPLIQNILILCYSFICAHTQSYSIDFYHMCTYAYEYVVIIHLVIRNQICCSGEREKFTISHFKAIYSKTAKVSAKIRLQLLKFKFDKRNMRSIKSGTFINIKCFFSFSLIHVFCLYKDLM